MTRPAPFWETKPLAALTRAEWESLCDGCGKCCLHKLEDEDTGRVHLTVVACKLLDVPSCRCTRYPERKKLVPGCVRITAKNLRSLELPSSCAYRCVDEGRPLPAWHPLVSGDAARVHAAGASVRAWAVSENDVEDPDDLEDYVVAVT
ncbi:MAG: YcgN family cysteine cluster protein [Polyangiales bacterium]